MNNVIQQCLDHCQINSWWTPEIFVYSVWLSCWTGVIPRLLGHPHPLEDPVQLAMKRTSSVKAANFRIY